MVYRYKVTLAGLKGFYRVYLCNGTNTLYTFHKQLRSDLEFAMDQPILFKGMDENDNCVARYALIDLGFGAVDSVRICDAIKAGVKSFIYFYDIPAKKSVIITLEGEEKDEKVTSPVLIDTKGPVPEEFDKGYVAFEDLPKEERKQSRTLDDEDEADEDDDDDEDEDDEDEDSEEEELIYDENE